ncbi:hypothetical protein D9619_003563 [Psilocybe cf. subviscida]|uniref:Nephrocystin 3-like N-terminal domain-containing protein n=1 Tax=Psilocybe cf. subviscida TaxID=2480587 RepID=A0A8H5EU67_9AGAR|nr:hypothetical protein D9619_003563 [Psilocybe cf. subviscida]
MPPGDHIHPTSSSDVHTASSSRYRRRDSGMKTSVFKNAANPRFENSSFIVNNVQGQDPLKSLYDQVATNAILNAGGRADEVKWERQHTQYTVTQWTRRRRKVCHRPNNRNPTRSTAQPLVATLLYQIVQVSPTRRQAIATVLSDSPLLFGASIQDQFNKLLSSPLRGISASLESSARRPIVLLIDGLDECDSEHKQSQRQILLALDHLLVQKNSPFLVLVASRAEPQIAMAFKQLASPVQSIFLDDQYSPEKDIRIFVTGEFDKIKKSHNLAHTLGDSWPSVDDTEAIVRKSSGQFIYAATVMRFLSNSSASPMLSLERVKGIVRVTKNPPISQLDAIYSYILSQADDQEAVKDFLAAKLFHNTDDSQKGYYIWRTYHFCLLKPY